MAKKPRTERSVPRRQTPARPRPPRVISLPCARLAGAVWVPEGFLCISWLDISSWCPSSRSWGGEWQWCSERSLWTQCRTLTGEASHACGGEVFPSSECISENSWAPCWLRGQVKTGDPARPADGCAKSCIAVPPLPRCCSRSGRGCERVCCTGLPSAPRFTLPKQVLK